MQLDEFGEIKQLSSEQVEWTIPLFYDLLQGDIIIRSPRFTFMGRKWEMLVSVNLGDTFAFAADGKKESGIDSRDDYIFRLSIQGSKGSITDFRVRSVREKNLIMFLKLDYSVLESMKDQETPDDNVSLFLTAEKPIDSSVNTVEYIQLKEGHKKLSQDFEKILANEELSNVVLKAGGREFKSHMCVLIARSPVFLDMMMHDMKEENAGVVVVDDVDARTFSDFLNYLYTGRESNVTSENALKLLAVAEKYQVNDLKRICMGRILSNISVDNFCDVLTLSLRHEKKFREYCYRFFKENSLAIVKTLKWQEFLIENPAVSNELYIKQIEMNK